MRNKLLKTIFCSIIVLLSLFFIGARTAQSEISRLDHFIYPQYSKKISMDFKDADLRTVLKIFSQQSGMNFISSSNIEDMRITLYFNNVPVEEALDQILNANNLMYELKAGSDIFVVKRMDKPLIELITRVFPLKHATVSNSEMIKNIKAQTEEDSDSEESESEDDEESGGTGILSAIEGVLTTSGTAIEDARTNSLIVTDIPSQFPVIEKTIASLDVPMPQILIEIEMLDISKTTGEDIGVKFGQTPLALTGGTKQTLYPFDQNEILRKERFSFGSDRYAAGTIDATGLTMVLEFLKSQTDTKTLANPSILTLNNQTAEIQIATDEAIGIVTSTGGAEGVVTQNVEAERADTGIFLSVTPQVNLETREITMAVFPRVIEARQGETFGGITFRDPEQRGTKSIMRVKNGETIYLGGLKKTNHAEIITKVPFLGDIPFFGNAFKHKKLSDENRELLMFITPKIVSDENYRIPTGRKKIKPLRREQTYPVTKLQEIERALLITEHQLNQK